MGFSEHDKPCYVRETQCLESHLVAFGFCLVRETTFYFPAVNLELASQAIISELRGPRFQLQVNLERLEIISWRRHQKLFFQKKNCDMLVWANWLPRRQQSIKKNRKLTLIDEPQHRYTPITNKLLINSMQKREQKSNNASQTAYSRLSFSTAKMESLNSWEAFSKWC